MADKNIGIKITLDGAKEFRQEMTNCKKESANFKSELNLISQQYKDSANSLEALTKKQSAYEKAVANQQKAVQALVTMQEKANSKLAEEEKSLNNAKTKRDELKKALEEAKKLYGENSEEVKKLAKELDDSNTSINKQETEVNKLKNKITDWNTEENKARAELDKLDDELKENEKYLKEAQSSTDKTAHSIDEFGNEVEEAKEEVSVFGDVLKANLASDVIVNGVKALAHAIKEMAQASVEVGSEFEASMSQVAATMGITADEIANGSREFQLLTEAAQKSGETTMFSASQAGEALNYLALAGYDAEKAASTLPKVLNLAAAGGMDLAYASDLVTDSMAALGLETSDLDNYIDQMAKTSQKSNTSISQLGEATLVVAGTATLAGQNLTTMNAELGVLANNGIKGAEGGTHLRNVLLSLSSPTDKAEKTLKKLGIEIEGSGGKMRDLNDIVIDLNRAMSGMGDVEKTQTIAKIFNKTDIAAVNALLKGTNGEFDTLVTNLENCEGAAQDMADTMNDNLKGQITILQSSLEGLGIAAYDIFDDSMKNSVKGATEAVGMLTREIKNGNLGVSLQRMGESMANFVDSAVVAGTDALPGVIDKFTWLIDNLDKIGVLVKSVGAGFVAYKTYAVGIEAINAAMNIQKAITEGTTVAQYALNTAMNANPVGLLVAAVAALTAGLIAYESVVDESTAATTKLVDASEKTRKDVEESAQSRQEDAKAMEAQGDMARQLASRLTDLQYKTNLTKEEQTEQAMIVKQLNELYPDLGLAIDETTGKLNMETKAIEANVDAAVQKAVVASYEEDLNEIIEDQVQLYKKKAENEKQAQELLSEYNITLDEFKGMLIDVDEVEQERNMTALENQGITRDTIWQVAGLVDANNQLEATYDELTQQYEEINGQIQEHTESLTGAQDSASQLSEQFYWVGDAIYTVSGATTEQITKLDTLQEEYQKVKEEATDSLNKQIGLFDELSLKSDMSINQMITNLESQVATLETYGSDLETVRDKVKGKAGGASLLSALESLGIDGAGYLHELASSSDAEMEKLLESFNKVEEAKGTVADTMADMATGMSEQLDAMMKNTDESGLTIVKTWENTMSSTASAVTNGGNQMVNAASNAANQTIQALDVYDEAEIQGENIPIGTANGIRAKTPEAVKAAQEMADAVTKASARKLDEHSPSKVFMKQGEFAVEGFEIGWSNESENMLEAVNETMNNVAHVNDNIKFNNESSDTKMINAINSLGSDESGSYLASILEAIKNFSGMNIVLDSGATVGELAPLMNQALGQISAREARR